MENGASRLNPGLPESLTESRWETSSVKPKRTLGLSRGCSAEPREGKQKREKACPALSVLGATTYSRRRHFQMPFYKDSVHFSENSGTRPSFLSRATPWQSHSGNGVERNVYSLVHACESVSLLRAIF